ncbi:amino acid permease [Campylobacter geochelonis]|uniref:amino acid permease n=1 Tax=Campylobacter geochelonis TaxID=1780362 RepID=UPI0007708D06|nr:amino acid permease [Campylobacter geochelonis]CZE47326.1 lysine-specific permease [Campylobacter geochelonis]CZE50549.1 lysine-specific permease [Campylobacter geochelonis]
MQELENHNFTNQGELKRKMSSRHLFMLSLGGVIGTGLFLSSGYTISQAGPFGAIVAYLVGALVVYLVMLCLGEMAVQMPVSGSFGVYASKFISPAAGFSVTWLYWICWAVALGTEFIGAAILMQRWFPDIEIWVFATFFAGLIFAINALSVRAFAEAEFFFSSIKVIAIVVFIVLGFGAIFGFVSFDGSNEAVLFSNLTQNGAFPNGAFAVLTVMLAVNYAFSGTELIGIAAGETKDPDTTIPHAIKTTVFRLVIFFVLTMIVLASLLSINEAGVTQAPFVVVFDKMDIPYAADIMNFVVLTAILSAGNSGLYACSRMLWSLSNEGMISSWVVKIDNRGVPMRALVLSMVGAILALVASKFAPDTIFIALVSIAGFAVVGVWLSIPISLLGFRKQWIKDGKSLDELKFKTPFFPYIPYIVIIILLLSLVSVAWDSDQRAGLIFGLPFVGFCYLYHYLKSRCKRG